MANTGQSHYKVVAGFPARLRKAVERCGGVDEVVYLAHPDLDRSSLYAWLAGTKQPSLRSLTTLLRALGISADELIFGSNGERQSA